MPMLYFDTHVTRQMELRRIKTSDVYRVFNSSPKESYIWEDAGEPDVFHIQSKTVRSPRSGCPLEIVLYKNGVLKTTMWKGEPDPA